MRAGLGSRLTWHVTYERLSSPVTVVMIAIPAKGKLGDVVVQLCRRSHCRPTMKGTMRLPRSVARALATRAGYVSIRTKENPRGEIRGRLLSS